MAQKSLTLDTAAVRTSGSPSFNSETNISTSSLLESSSPISFANYEESLRI